MARMGAADSGNSPGVARRCKPVVHRCANLSPLDRRLSGAVMAGDQEHEAISGIGSAFQSGIDRVPCAVEIEPVKIDDAIGLDASGAELAIPCAVERGSRPGGSRR
jgi:hypothetical protein